MAYQPSFDISTLGSSIPENFAHPRKLLDIVAFEKARPLLLETWGFGDAGGLVVNRWGPKTGGQQM